MNLAYIIDKMQYLKIQVESIEVERRDVEVVYTGNLHSAMLYGGPPITKMTVIVDNNNLNRFYREVDLQKKVICECRTQGVFDLADKKTVLTEFIPIEITYTPDGERHNHSKLNITCCEFNLIIC